MNSLTVENNNQIFNKVNTSVYIDYSKETNIYVGTSPHPTMVYYPKNSLAGANRNNTVFSKKYGFEKFYNISKATPRVYLNEISNENLLMFHNNKLMPTYTANNDYVPTFYPATSNLFAVNLDIANRQDFEDGVEVVAVNQSNLLRYERHADLNQNSFDLSTVGTFSSNSLLFIDGVYVPREIAGIINWEINANMLNMVSITSSRKHVVLIGGLTDRVNNGYYISNGDTITLDPDMNYTNTLIFANGKPIFPSKLDIDTTTGIGKVRIITNEEQIAISICKRTDVQEFNMYPSVSIKDGVISHDNGNEYFMDYTLIQVKTSDDTIEQSTKIDDISNNIIHTSSKLSDCIYGDFYYYTTAYVNKNGKILYDENGNLLTDEINRFKSATIKSPGSYAVVNDGKVSLLEQWDSFYLGETENELYKNVARFSSIFDADFPVVSIDSRTLISVMLNGRLTNEYTVNGNYVTFDKDKIKTRHNIVTIMTAEKVIGTDCIVLEYMGHEKLNMNNLTNYQLINNIVSFSDSPILEFADVSIVKHVNTANKIRISGGGSISLQTFDMNSENINKLDFSESRLILTNADGMYKIYCSCNSDLSSTSLEMEHNGYSYTIDYATATKWRNL